jgi:hypothetical protein
MGSLPHDNPAARAEYCEHALYQFRRVRRGRRHRRLFGCWLRTCYPASFFEEYLTWKHAATAGTSKRT